MKVWITIFRALSSVLPTLSIFSTKNEKFKILPFFEVIHIAVSDFVKLFLCLDGWQHWVCTIVYLIVVVDRVYPNPKTRRVFSHFYKPEATRTRTFCNFENPELPEPEVFRISETRSYPNPKFKPAGTRRVLDVFSKPEETRTRTFDILQYPNPIKPEILFQYETR